MTQKDAKTSRIVSLSKLLIASYFAHVMFDTGVMHSFVSTAFVRNYGMPYVVLNDALIVGTPVG